jgi:Protein of unknown function (DUF3662)/FHA domain
MSVFRRIEQTLETTFERGFRRAFKSQLQPVELARKLAREMDLNKTISVAKVYVPNEYTVHLSPPDHEAFSSYEATLTHELATYLEAHARGSGFSLVAPPSVAMTIDPDLRAGEFGISCRMADAPVAEALPPPLAPGSPAPGAEAPAPDDALDAVPTPVVAPSVPVASANPALAGVSGTQVISAAEAQASGLHPETMTLILNGERIPLTKRVTSLGRSRERDVVVADPNVSRQHCEIRHVGYDYFLIDLDSTNGVSVNGRPVTRHALTAGDVIAMGATQIRVEVS